MVAHLIRKNLGLLSHEENSQLDSTSFKFILYASFPSKEDSVARDLCEGLSQLCGKQGLKNFQFIERLSNVSKERWNSDFIKKTIEPHHNDLARIWVCGPPRMNEDFDKTLEVLAKTVKTINRDVYEIM